MASESRDMTGGVWVFRRRAKPGDALAAHAVLLSHAEHRELIAAHDARVSAGENADTAWRNVVAAARCPPTWTLSAMLEIERRRLRLGLSEDAICERAGIAERGYAKWRRSWVPGTGRIPSRVTLDVLAATVLGGTGNLAQLMAGVRARAMTRGEYDAALARLAIRHGRDTAVGYARHMREHMRRIAPLGLAARVATQNPDVLRLYGMRGGWAAAEAMTREQRCARARKAAKARWDRVRADYARWTQHHGLSAC